MQQKKNSIEIASITLKFHKNPPIFSSRIPSPLATVVCAELLLFGLVQFYGFTHQNIHIILWNMQITIITVDWWWNIARDYRHYFSYANLYYHINEKYFMKKVWKDCLMNLWNVSKCLEIYAFSDFLNLCEFMWIFLNLFEFM